MKLLEEFWNQVTEKKGFETEEQILRLVSILQLVVKVKRTYFPSRPSKGFVPLSNVDRMTLAAIMLVT